MKKSKFKKIVLEVFKKLNEDSYSITTVTNDDDLKKAIDDYKLVEKTYKEFYEKNKTVFARDDKLKGQVKKQLAAIVKYMDEKKVKKAFSLTNNWIAELITLSKNGRIQPNYKELYEEALEKVTSEARLYLENLRETQIKAKTIETTTSVNITSNVPIQENVLDSFKNTPLYKYVVNLFKSANSLYKSAEALPVI